MVRRCMEGSHLLGMAQVGRGAGGWGRGAEPRAWR
jgi:hypothetical protein